MALFGRFGHAGPYRKGEIKISYTKSLIVMEIIGILMILGIFVYTAIKYHGISGQIPTHFDGFGQADAWGSKMNLWMLPGVALIIYILVTISAFFPSSWNYPVKVSEERLPEAENKVRQMLSSIKIIISGMFIYLQYEMLKLSESISLVITFGFIAILFAVTIGFMISIARLSSRKK